MRKRLLFVPLFYGIVLALLSNSYLFLAEHGGAIFPFVALFLAVNIFAGTCVLPIGGGRNRALAHGTVTLAAFLWAAGLSVLYHIVLAFPLFASGEWLPWVISAAVCVLSLAIVLWNGLISVYLTSLQMGIKRRLLAALGGLIPVLNVIVLGKIIKVCRKELETEYEREQINRKRSAERLCQTKYPILMVHGVFFRDIKQFNYWGRIPRELIKNGATVFYGNHASASSIADSAAELSKRIEEVLETTGAEKVNIIAHSKGGLDCRYAMAYCGMAEKIASLTTINTPHRGCLFAEYLLDNISEDFKQKVASTYNDTLKKLGEENADFLAAVGDLKRSHLVELDKKMPPPEGVFCQSVGSVLTAATGGKFPLNLSYNLVKIFDGENDGLVSEPSFSFGEKYTLLRPNGKRGISHGDMIDLNRENIEGFDVREFYVTLVNELKNKGL